MRLASFNVENLFDRAKVMNLETYQQGSEILDNYAKLNTLLALPNYTDQDKKTMLNLINKLGMGKDDTAEYTILRRNKGGLLKRTKTEAVSITADGRADWVGSLELIEEPIDMPAIANTARVIRDIKADVLGIIEVESRPVLRDFNQQNLVAVGGKPFGHVMVIDGNDTRGIDVGIMSKSSHPIGIMRSHVDDHINGKNIFKRDCPEFEIITPNNTRIFVMVAHLKSKAGKNQESASLIRKNEAERISEIYKALRINGEKYIAVVGDFNDTPSSPALAPLLNKTDLKDIFNHVHFDNGGYAGTYGSCSEQNKIDYILLSPDLFAQVQNAGVIRSGMWPGAREKKWQCYPEITRPQDAASDHAALWVDLNI